MTMSTVLQRADHTTFEVAAGEAIIIHLDTGNYFSLNEVGSDFWQALDGQTTLQDHAAKLASEYDAPIDVIANDLQELATQLVQDDLAHEV